VRAPPSMLWSDILILAPGVPVRAEELIE